MASKILLEKSKDPETKFELQSDVSSWELAAVYSTPVQDLEKDQIKEITQKAKEAFFA